MLCDVTFGPMDEILDVLDERGYRTGETALKSEMHRLGLWHRCFHCWIVDPTGWLFVQRRAAAKETWPGRLDVTAAGHLLAGEEPLDGLRELEEELGLRIRPERLLDLGTRISVKEIPHGMDREFQEVFLLVENFAFEQFRLQKEEVAAILRIGLDEIERLRHGVVVKAEEWDGYSGISAVTVRGEDFVPDEDAYLLAILDSAREALAGRDAAGTFRETSP